MDNVLITGGAGFIGSHLAEKLLDEGQRVLVLDNFDPFYDPGVKRRNLAGLVNRHGFTLVEGDIRDREVLDRIIPEGGIDTVIHLAARAGVRPSIEDPELYQSVNLEGTVRLLEACRRHGIGRFVFGSSSSVYGNNSKVPFAETDPVDHPVSPYAATKKSGELLCHTYHHLFGLKVACLRFFTVFGPRQRPEMAIHKFARLLATGQPVEQYGDGSTARDYTYVSDIVDGIVRAADHLDGYDIWNLGGSRTTPLRELIETIASKLGVPVRVRQLPMQPGDVNCTWADISRARGRLGWEPKVSLEDGLTTFLEWFDIEQRRSRAEGKP